MKRIFLAFPGYQVKIRGKVKKIGDCEFWNLKQIDEKEFLAMIQSKIPPLNKNVTSNYFGFNSSENYSKSYKHTAWGVLLPDYSKYDNMPKIDSSLLVIHLYSGLSSPLTFYVNRLGIEIRNTSIQPNDKSNAIRVELLANNKFQKFYEQIFPVIDRSELDTALVIRWNKEQWRLCVACQLFKSFQKYQFSKDIMTWQKECAEAVNFYETLLSVNKGDYGKFKMMQRIKVMLGKFYEKNKDLEQGLGAVFDHRNEFLHGDFFNRLKKMTKPYPNDNKMAQLPIMDFRFLREQGNLLRMTFIVFLHLSKKFEKVRSKTLQGLSIPEIIQHGIMDIQTRKRIQQYSEEILKLL